MATVRDYSEAICHGCSQKGHILPQCPDKRNVVVKQMVEEENKLDSQDYDDELLPDEQSGIVD